MANKIYKVSVVEPCPRCTSKKARVCNYRCYTSFTAECTAECAECGFGLVRGDDAETAVARYYGECLERGLSKEEKNENNSKFYNHFYFIRRYKYGRGLR